MMYSVHWNLFLECMLASASLAVPTAVEKRQSQIFSGSNPGLGGSANTFALEQNPALASQQSVNNPQQACTPKNSVVNPDFEQLNPLTGWTVSNRNNTMGYVYTTPNGVNNNSLFGRKTAYMVVVQLTGPTSESGSISQEVEICPSSPYQFSCAFLWANPDLTTNKVKAPRGASNLCSVTLNLGNNSATYPFLDIPSTDIQTLLANNPPDAGGFNGLFTYLDMNNTFISGPQDTVVQIEVTVSCNSPGAFDGSPHSYSPTLFIDNCNLIPKSGPLATRSTKQAPPAFLEAAAQNIVNGNSVSNSQNSPIYAGNGRVGVNGPLGGSSTGGPNRINAIMPAFSPPNGAVTPPIFPSIPTQQCTPWNSVLNPQFDGSDPLAHWNLSNPVDSGFLDKSGYYDGFYYNSTNGGGISTPGPAASISLSSSGPDYATFSQSIQVCPNTNYTFSIEFLWTQTDYLGNLASLSVPQGCSLTLGLGSGPGKATNTIPFGTLPNITPNTVMPSAYGLVKLDKYYSTGPDETRTNLSVTVACNANVKSNTGYKPTAYFDNVNLSWM